MLKNKVINKTILAIILTTLTKVDYGMRESQYSDVGATRIQTERFKCGFIAETDATPFVSDNLVRLPFRLFKTND